MSHNIPTLTIPATRVNEFMAQYDPKLGLRLGQAFYQFMALEKITTDSAWCEALYQADGQRALAMIQTITDYQN
ncbi:hypothetical protein LUCX_203 [Xanthomonas phage vB_XciM_LucasX]|nr:hypothetical protein LUCX_203 [Xanthomonas phage vB_XciM_LucasX]